MDKKETEKFRRMLLELKSEILEVEASSRDSTRPVILDQTTVGRLSRMDAIQGQQMALETSRRRQQQLLRIENALRNIDKGEYGDCQICGEAIDPRRLAIDPAATRCIGCVDS